MSHLVNFLLRRLVQALLTMVVTALAVFCLFRFTGADPAVHLAGRYGNAEQAAMIRHSLGLDRSFLVQYLGVLRTFFTFDFGRSWYSKQLIATRIWEEIPTSLAISLPGFLASNMVSIPVALTAAYFRGKQVDKLLIFCSVMLMSVPILSYVMAFQYYLAYRGGLAEISGYQPGFPANLRFLLLPWLIFIVLSLGHQMRFYRTVFLEQMYEDYIRTARAKGLSTPVILWRHLLPNTAVTLITHLLLQLPSLLLGTLIIESYFNIPGVGKYFLTSVATKDLPVIQASTILVSVAYILCSTLADILYAVVDPRLRLQK